MEEMKESLSNVINEHFTTTKNLFLTPAQKSQRSLARSPFFNFYFFFVRECVINCFMIPYSLWFHILGIPNSGSSLRPGYCWTPGFATWYPAVLGSSRSCSPRSLRPPPPPSSTSGRGRTSRRWRPSPGPRTSRPGSSSCSGMPAGLRGSEERLHKPEDYKRHFWFALDRSSLPCSWSSSIGKNDCSCLGSRFPMRFHWSVPAKSLFTLQEETRYPWRWVCIMYANGCKVWKAAAIEYH